MELKKYSDVCPGQSETKPQLSNFRLFLMSVYWFASGAMWTSLLIILMPSQVKYAVGDGEKTKYLGIATAIGAAISLVAAPIFGALSDRVKLPGGKRKPWVVIGTLGQCIGLVGMAYLIKENDLNSYYYWIVAYLLVIIFNNVAVSPYTALIPDNVPHNQRGVASGFLGLMTMFGLLFGGTTGILYELVQVECIYYILIGNLMLCAIITWFGVSEVDAEVDSTPKFTTAQFLKSLIEPFSDSDFTWVFSTRMLVMFGIFLIQNFIQYYFDDVVKEFKFNGKVVAESAEKAASLFVPAMTLGAILTTSIAGYVSDKFGRKIVVFAAGCIMSIVVLVLMVTADFAITILMGFVFGLGYGAYISVDWALISDVLPSDDDYAKDMGIWHIADVVPQVLSGSLGGMALALGNKTSIENFGYKILFIISLLSYILGTVFVYKIKRVR
jgi:MFS family permease